MLLWRKRKNRKVGREQVLDVKLRSSKLKAARTRMVAIGLGSFFALVFGICFCFWAFDSGIKLLIYENPAFAIKEIDVQTDGVLSPEQLQRWTGVRKGQNLLALDLNTVRRQLELIPLVETVTIDRVPPSALRIRIVERVPLAQIHVPMPGPGGGVELKTFHVDGQGYVMLPPTPAQRSSPAAPSLESLPVISGVPPADVQPGRRIESQQFHAALRLLLSFERSDMAGLVELKRIDVSAPEILIASAEPGCTVTFGLKDHELQLARWREIYRAARNMGKALVTVDLAVSNNIPVTFTDASLVPMLQKPNPKSPQSRRKHV